MNDTINDEPSTEDSGAVGKPAVLGSYLFKYRSMGMYFQVPVHKATMAEAIQFFGRYYSKVDEILWAGWVHS